MALIKCPECGKEISDTIKKCPNCGYKVKKQVNKKKMFIIGIISLILLIGGCATIMVIKNNNIKQQEKLVQEYDNLIVETGAKIYVNGVLAQYHSSGIAGVWYDCIKSKYCSDFSNSIKSYMTQNEKALTSLKDNKTEIEKSMQKLKSVPTNDYQDAYEKIVEFYGYYSKLVDCATNPSGNYTGYLSNYNSYSSDFKSAYNQLIVLIPKIKDYKETTKEQ